MKFVHESIFMNSLRAFFVAFFGILGALIALAAIIILIGIGISSSPKEDKFSAKVKILPDAQGHRKHLGSHSPVILQISLDGEIGTDPLTADKIQTILLESQEDEFQKERVKGILLVLNSPGGTVNDSDIIYRYLKEYKARYHVPIFAFVDGLCASGGYYIACAADKIFASDVSLIGSIGVVSWPPFINVSDAMEKIGVSALTVLAGKGKDDMNPFRPWKPDEQKNYQHLIDYYYKRFVSLVQEDRPKVDADKLVQEFGAKVFPAPQAEENGLIDTSGSTRSLALTALAKEANIEGEYQVVTFETKSWWKRMFKEEAQSPLFTGKIRHELAWPKQKGNPVSYLFAPSHLAP